MTTKKTQDKPETPKPLEATQDQLQALMKEIEILKAATKLGDDGMRPGYTGPYTRGSVDDPKVKADPKLLKAAQDRKKALEEQQTVRAAQRAAARKR